MQTSTLPKSGPPSCLLLPASIAGALRTSGFEPLACPEEPEAARRWLETALMTAFRDSGREDVFEALYRVASASMLRWISHLLASRRQEGDPLEVLQDTFVNIFRYARGFRSENGCTFSGWARTIAANLVRRAGMRRKLLFLSALPSGVAEPMDQRAGPQQCCQSSEQEAQLGKAWTLLLLHYARAFQSLGERDRMALELIEVEGMSYTEAGARLRVGRSNMKMIMFRARKRLRALMARAMPDEGGRELEREEPFLRAVG